MYMSVTKIQYIRAHTPSHLLCLTPGDKAATAFATPNLW